MHGFKPQSRQLRQRICLIFPSHRDWVRQLRQRICLILRYLEGPCLEAEVLDLTISPASTRLLLISVTHSFVTLICHKPRVTIFQVSRAACHIVTFTADRHTTNRVVCRDDDNMPMTWQCNYTLHVDWLIGEVMVSKLNLRSASGECESKSVVSEYVSRLCMHRSTVQQSLQTMLSLPRQL